MDKGIGRIVSVLKEYDELDNTLLVFLSDNGATGETRGGKLTKDELPELGQEESNQTYRANWANVSNTPFRWFKMHEYEGGNKTPFIVHWPGDLGSQSRVNREQKGHVIDIMPTFLEVAGAEYPEQHKGNDIHPVQGKSLLPAFRGDSFDRGPLFLEHEANRAVRDGKWKLVANAASEPPYKGEWESYNLEEDPAETHNLAGQYPEKVEELSAKWNQWAENNNVYPLDGRGWGARPKDEHNE